MPGLNWGWTTIAVSASFHSAAILSTLFRLWYRWHTGLLWWDDAWAFLGFSGEVACLVTAVIEQPISSSPRPRFVAVGDWIFSFAYPTVMWATRISILVSMVRVSRPEGALKYITFGIGYVFGLMAMAMFALRLQACLTDACFMVNSLLIAQTSTDCIADILLSALPIWSLRNVQLSRSQKILVSSSFWASMVINVVTVVEAVTLFRSKMTTGSIVYEHVKVACSMIVCNLLVIVTFVYRVLHRDRTGLDDSMPNTGEQVFSTVVDPIPVSWLSQDTNKGASESSLPWSQLIVLSSVSVATSSSCTDAGSR